MNNQTTLSEYQNNLLQSAPHPVMQKNDEESINFNTLLCNSLNQYQSQLANQNQNEIKAKDSPLKIQTSPSKNYQYSFGNDANLNIQMLALQQQNQNLESLPNLQYKQSLQSPPYSGDPKNPSNYLYISSLPGSKYGSQTQIHSIQSQNQLSNHNLQTNNLNQQSHNSHQHPLTIQTPRYGSNGRLPSSKQGSQPEIKSYKQMKAIHRESKLLTPTSAFSPEIQKVIEDMKQKQMIQTNDSSDFTIQSQIANSQKSEGNNNQLTVNQDSKNDFTDQRRLSAVEIFQLKSHQIVIDLNSIQQQVRIDSANVAMKKNTMNTFNNLMSSQNSSQANFNDQNNQKQLVRSKNNSNIQSLTCLDKQNLPTEASRLQKSKYQQYQRNSITSERFNKDRARLKEALLAKNNKIDYPLYNSKIQTISLPDISYGQNSHSEIGSDKKNYNTRQVKTKGSLEHLDDLEDSVREQFALPSSNRNSSSNQSSPRKKKLESSMQDDQKIDIKLESPSPQLKLNGNEVLPIKYQNAVSNLLLKKSLDCVNEVFQDQESRILPSPQFAKSNHHEEKQEDEKLSQVDTFSSSSNYSSGSPLAIFRNEQQSNQSSVNIVQKYFKLSDQIEKNNGLDNQKRQSQVRKQNEENKPQKDEIIQYSQYDKVIEDSKHNDAQEQVKRSLKVKENRQNEEAPKPNQKQQLVDTQLNTKSSISSLKNDKLSLPITTPITITDIQPNLESERKQNDEQYQILLKKQQQLNIQDFSPIRYEEANEEGSNQDKFFGKNDNQQSQKKNSQQQNNRYQSSNQQQHLQKQKKQKEDMNKNNNIDQISQKLIQNQLLKKNNQDKSDMIFAQQAFNSFGSDVDLQQFLQDIQYKQEEEKRIQLQNQLIEARLDLDNNQRSILYSMNPSPRMTGQQGYLLTPPYPTNTKSFGDFVGSDILALSSELNLQYNPNTNQRKSLQSNQGQYINNLQERINSQIQSQSLNKQQQQQQQQQTPRTVAIKKEQLRESYYQKYIQYQGDGKYKSPKRVSVKSDSGHDIQELEYVEENLHVTNILSDHYVETLLNQPEKKQQSKAKSKPDFYQPSYLRSTKSFTQSVKSVKNAKENNKKEPILKKFKYK